MHAFSKIQKTQLPKKYQRHRPLFFMNLWDHDLMGKYYSSQIKRLWEGLSYKLEIFCQGSRALLELFDPIYFGTTKNDNENSTKKYIHL